MTMAIDCVVEEYIEKLSPKKGDILVFHCPNDVDGAIKAQSVYNQMTDLAAQGVLDKDIPVLILYGDDGLSVMTTEDLKRAGLQRIPS